MPTPRRLVSLSPNISMMLFALEADAMVIGRTQGCLAAIQQYLTVWRMPAHTAAPRVQYWETLPVVGTWPLADRAAIRALRPERILTAGSGPFGVHAAETLGMPPEAVQHFDTRTLHDLEQHLQQLGALLGKTAQASRLIAQLAQRRDEAQARLHARAVRPTVLFEYCVCTQYDADPHRRVTNPAQTVLVGGHLAPELMQLSGGMPLFTQPGDSARWVAFDEILAAQPDVILQYDCHGCPAAMQQPLAARPGWAALNAVRRGTVYPVNENLSNPTLCFPSALEELVEVLQQYAVE